MAQEIERKFLIKNDTWRELSQGQLYRQGYLSTDAEKTVRVRIIGAKSFLTIKGKSVGPTRNEFEYEIPTKDANIIINELCDKPIIEKHRYKIQHRGFTWEVDEFLGVNAGLVIAEVELSDEAQEIELPDWIGEEVTDDPRYYNANLITNPYSQW